MCRISVMFPACFVEGRLIREVCLGFRQTFWESGGAMVMLKKEKKKDGNAH